MWPLSDTSKLVKSLKNLICSCYDLATMYDLATTVDTLRQLYFAKNIDNLLVQLILVGPTDNF
jgi:hypothetical protein